MSSEALLVILAAWVGVSVLWGVLRPSPERIERTKRAREELRAARRRARVRVTDEERS